MSLLVRKVKFNDFENEGKALFSHCLYNPTSVLILNTDGVIDVRTKCGVGELLLAEVHMSDLNIASFLSYDIHRSLSEGFRAARLGYRDGIDHKVT